MDIGIVAQKGKSTAVSLAADLRDALADAETSVLVDATTADEIGGRGVPTEELSACPLVVSVGGDGTFLYAARHVGSTPILGVNLGEVGFLNAVPPDDAFERVLEEVEHIRDQGEPRFREVPRIEGHGDNWALPPGLNEFLIQGPRRGPGGGLDATIAVDGSTYVSTHLDGVIVATTTGSTAYNLSEGGPLVHPNASGLLVNAMCPQHPARPLMVGPEASIEIEVDGAEEAVVASDGSERRWIDVPATIEVEVAAEPGRIAGPRSDFFTALEKID